MKTFVLIAALFICFNGFAQQDYDTIYAVVNGNNVTIHQDNAYQNCGFSPGLKHVTIFDTIVNWYQIDTIGIFYGCMCFFDYSVDIDSLKAGHYTANVYSVYDLGGLAVPNFEGSTTFSIERQIKCDTIVQLASIASPCHEYVGIKKYTPNGEPFGIVQSRDWISVISKGAEKIGRVVISNLSGQEVLSNEYNSVSEIYLPTTSLKKGYYIITVYENNRMIMNRKVILSN